MAPVSDTEHQSYGLEPTPETPRLPGTVRVGEDREETLDAVAADLFVQSSNCVSAFGEFHLALSHGAVQERLVMKLMTDPKYRSIPWERTHLWSISEMLLEPGHPEHSMTHWRELAAEPGCIPDQQLHAVHGHRPDGAAAYARELIEHLEWRERGHDRLDFVILGDDLGLIEGVDDPADQLVGFSSCQSRIVMTRRLVNSSRFIGVLGVGGPGRAMVDELSDGHHRIGLAPDGGVLRWYLDAYACGHTQEEPE